MGKSLGNTLDPVELVDKYGADAIRYYFLKEIEFGKDGDFNETRFIDILNADLANDLGNLLNRTLGMAHKYCEGVVPAITSEEIPSDNPLKEIGLELSDRVASAYENLAFSTACKEIFSLIRLGNKFLAEQAPWTLYKEGKQQAVEMVLYTALESVRLAAYLLAPIIPGISTDIYQQLGFAIDFNDKNSIQDAVSYTSHTVWGTLKHNQRLSKPKPVFARIEQR
jgi:methionyl-tRNA synthetase